MSNASSSEPGPSSAGAALADALRDAASLLDRQHVRRHQVVQRALDDAYGPHAVHLATQHGRLQAEAWELIALLRRLATNTEHLVEVEQRERSHEASTAPRGPDTAAGRPRPGATTVSSAPQGAPHFGRLR